jgi:DNA-binding transcriptional MocR family regulator
LEVLALQARQDAAGALVVVIGVRELADQLGVGRDAAANALSTLRSLGVISAVQQRAGRGRFDGTRHTILLPVRAEPVPASRARSRRSRPVREATTPTALVLFDEPTDPPGKDVTDARGDRHADHSSQVAVDVPRKVHELAFDRMPSDAGERGTSSC